MAEQIIGIIGAGIAGLACAERLASAGRSVSVFDKGRSVGGRIATRRLETSLGSAQFDHGAQFFTARDPAFLEALSRQPPASHGVWHGDGVGHDWRVAAPGLSALPKALSVGLSVMCSVKIDAIEQAGEGWCLVDETGAPHGPFSHVVVSTPAEQAAPLLAPVSPALAAQAASAVTAPCWAGLFAFAEPATTARVAFALDNHDTLAWLACDSAKPDRPQAVQCWVAHATPAWTRAHLEDDSAFIAASLFEAVRSMLGVLAAPVVMQAHRWRYAKVERATGAMFGWDAVQRIATCGDWHVGPRVECAWQSGHALAGAMLDAM